MVDETALDCARLNEDFWEPSSLDSDLASARDDETEHQRLQLFTRPRRLTPAAETAGFVARSSSGGGSGGGWNAPGGSAGAGDDPPPSAPRRPNRAATPQGQERGVSYQPEERYWTDYLRIALPVVGLLLMLGLFWYWASKVIGDSGNSPKPTATVQIAITTAEAPTATTQAVVPLTPQVVVTATNPAGPATEGNSGAAANNNGATTGGSANPTATTAANNASSGNSTSNSTGNSSANSTGGNSAGGSNPSKFGAGDTVQTSSDNVNMRSDHSITASVIEPIAATGTELNVTGNGVKSGDYTWIPVTDPATGQSGWVADSLVEAVNP